MHRLVLAKEAFNRSGLKCFLSLAPSTEVPLCTLHTSGLESIKLRTSMAAPAAYGTAVGNSWLIDWSSRPQHCRGHFFSSGMVSKCSSVHLQDPAESSLHCTALNLMKQYSGFTNISDLLGSAGDAVTFFEYGVPGSHHCGGGAAGAACQVPQRRHHRVPGGQRHRQVLLPRGEASSCSRAMWRTSMCILQSASFANSVHMTVEYR